MKTNFNSALFNTPIAHRGLWNKDFVENSIPAYRNAVENGYPIETDIYASTDDEIFCFHDKTLVRMTGSEGNIFDKSSKEIKSLKLLNSTESIPTLRELLSTINGKVPVLIEIKNQPDKKIVEKTLDVLKDYKGEFAIQSFNPIYIYRVKKIAPNVIRGILATNDRNDLKSEKPLTRFIIKHMALNFLIKPHFISYKHTGIPLKKHKVKNKKILCWTVTDDKTFNRVKPFVDNVIFENFIPKD